MPVNNKQKPEITRRPRSHMNSFEVYDELMKTIIFFRKDNRTDDLTVHLTERNGSKSCGFLTSENTKELIKFLQSIK